MNRQLDVVDLFLLPAAFLLLHVALVAVRVSKWMTRVAVALHKAALFVARTTIEEADRG
jgi:hypothetical protein